MPAQASGNWRSLLLVGYPWCAPLCQGGSTGLLLRPVRIFAWGPYLMMLRNYSWLCSQGSFLAALWGTVWDGRSKTCISRNSQVLYLHYYCSGPQLSFFYGKPILPKPGRCHQFMLSPSRGERGGLLHTPLSSLADIRCHSSLYRFLKLQAGRSHGLSPS